MRSLATARLALSLVLALAPQRRLHRHQRRPAALASPWPHPHQRRRLSLLEARFAVTRALVAIEGARSAAGTYPRDASVLSLPEDPLAPGRPLRYEAAPGLRGYRIWSAGTNERDDGGTSCADGDLVVERAGP